MRNKDEREKRQSGKSNESLKVCLMILTTYQCNIATALKTPRSRFENGAPLAIFALRLRLIRVAVCFRLGGNDNSERTHSANGHRLLVFDLVPCF